MPVMHFHVEWPDGSAMRCYSPSLVVKDFMVPGERYAVDDFLARSREALSIASERVRAKYGFACSQAMDQLAEIEAMAARFEGPAPGEMRLVRVLAFEE